jgi:hypothetical protein
MMNFAFSGGRVSCVRVLGNWQGMVVDVVEWNWGVVNFREGDVAAVGGPPKGRVALHLFLIVCGRETRAKTARRETRTVQVDIKSENIQK